MILHKSFFNPNKWNYIRVKGLRLIKGIHCPHFNGQTKYIKRRKNFRGFMNKYMDMGIAVDNHCAISIKELKEYKPLEELYDR